MLAGNRDQIESAVNVLGEANFLSRIRQRIQEAVYVYVAGRIPVKCEQLLYFIPPNATSTHTNGPVGPSIRE